MAAYKFYNRTLAGKELAGKLQSYAGKKDVLVLALSRGGVPVAFEIASSLSAALDVLPVRKLSVPCYTIGAVTIHNICILDHDIVTKSRIPKIVIEQVIAKERLELYKYNIIYRSGKPAPYCKNKIVIIVDDGLANGATARAAIAALQEFGAKQIVIAVPVGSRAICEELKAKVDSVICLLNPEFFYGVGQWYEDFSRVAKEDIQDLLFTANKEIKLRNNNYNIDDQICVNKYLVPGTGSLSESMHGLH